ncbi:hypothetical protein [Leptolyngbya sp. 7M]|uniref:hypothetical protein n=1 Tax=Leptolyngbya sp. 7M TaxID=2812896 RepID=UPI001B8CBEEC|nr:hypothetical protein [Leptolyngbya sp. 7M]QYO62782.1 hypothetical protein JVX88_22505 [Leptolyngbya sp. 7M]
MMNTLTIVSAAITLIVGILSILGTFAKVQTLLNRLETRDLELREEMRVLRVEMENLDDRLSLTTQGLKERVEHINLRVSTQLKEVVNTVGSIEAYLQKNTTYERRNSS